MPVDGYESVNLPTGLYNRIDPFVGKKKRFGYRSKTDFVSDAVRRRTEELFPLDPQTKVRVEIKNGNL